MIFCSFREVMYVSYIGELFLRMLKALILPLIVPSLITAVGSLDMSLSGKVSCLYAKSTYFLETILFQIQKFPFFNDPLK